MFVRSSKLSDVEDLFLLEIACWDEHLRSSREVIKERIEYDSSIQFVLEVNNSICGVLYTQRISDANCLSEGKFNSLRKYRCEDGKVLQLIAIAVKSDLEENLGAFLRNFVLQAAIHDNSINDVVAITRYVCDK